MLQVRPLYEFDSERRQRIIKAHLSSRWSASQVTGPVEGAYGEVYSIILPLGQYPARIAAKCPKFKRFGNAEKARAGVEQALRELEKAHNVYRIPWVNRLFELQFIHGWPFIQSAYHDGSLEDLIANPLSWTVADRITNLIQILRALILAAKAGIASHQDLKPDNVFFDELCRRGVPRDSPGMHFHMLVGDFGLADAFRDLGRNTGSRPYMAPEQYRSEPPEPGAPVLFDVFAVGVLTCECFADGLHPIGRVTADVWPWQRGVEQKWNRESTWRGWAEARQKTLPNRMETLPLPLRDITLASLAVEPPKRPSLEEFEQTLWDCLRHIDHSTCEGFRMQVDHMESHLSGPNEGWPHRARGD
jgi:serine/threonine protein kinase